MIYIYASDYTLNSKLSALPRLWIRQVINWDWSKNSSRTLQSLRSYYLFRYRHIKGFSDEHLRRKNHSRQEHYNLKLATSLLNIKWTFQRSRELTPTLQTYCINLVHRKYTDIILLNSREFSIKNLARFTILPHELPEVSLNFMCMHSSCKYIIVLNHNPTKLGTPHWKYYDYELKNTIRLKYEC